MSLAFYHPVSFCLICLIINEILVNLNKPLISCAWVPVDNLYYERWQREAGCAAVIILIFGKQQEIWEEELDWRDIFPVRRPSSQPVWHQQNASRPPLGIGKQLCHTIVAQSDQTEERTAGRHAEPNVQSPVEVKAHRNTLSKSSLLFPIWQERGWREPAFLKHLLDTQHDWECCRNESWKLVPFPQSQWVFSKMSKIRSEKIWRFEEALSYNIKYISKLCYWDFKISRYHVYIIYIVYPEIT